MSLPEEVPIILVNKLYFFDQNITKNDVPQGYLWTSCTKSLSTKTNKKNVITIQIQFDSRTFRNQFLEGSRNPNKGHKILLVISRKIIKSIRDQIAFVIFRLVSNQTKNGKYNPISVDFTRIRRQFLCTWERRNPDRCNNLFLNIIKLNQTYRSQSRFSDWFYTKKEFCLVPDQSEKRNYNPNLIQFKKI